MSTRPAPRFLTLLESVYPKLEDEEAGRALLEHCADLVRDPDYGPPPTDTRVAQKALGALRGGNYKVRAGCLAATTLVRVALVQTVAPWKKDKARGSTAGWGWAAMQDAAATQDAQTLNALMSRPDGPSAQEINDRTFSYKARDRKGEEIQVQGDILELFFQDITLGSDPARSTGTIKALAQAGVDFNRAGRDDLLPMAHVINGHDLIAMVGQGARLDAQSGGRLAICQAIENIHDKFVPGLVQACETLAIQNPGAADQLRQSWPAVLESLGRALSRARDAQSMRADLAAIQSLANSLGASVCGKHPGEGNVLASWARSNLTKPDQYSNRQFPGWKELIQDLNLRHKWGGQIEPGIPNGAWGLLMEAQREGYRKNLSFSRERAAWFSNDDDASFWPGMLRLFETMSEHASTWQALIVLRSVLPKATNRDFRKVVMAGFVKYREENDDPYGNSEAVSALNQEATLTLKPIAQGVKEVMDPELVNLALRAFMVQGFRSSVARGALERMVRDHPHLLDGQALARSLAVGRQHMDGDPSIRAGVEAALLVLQTPTTPERGRPRF